MSSNLIRRILVAAIMLVSALSAQTEKKPQYEIYAIRYGSVASYPASQMVQGADPSRKVPIAMALWLIRGNGRNILVDSGFYHEKFFKIGKIDNFVKPSEAVAQLGVKPEEVTDIIISHMH